MPIYEFYCAPCGKLLSFFSRRVNTGATPPCPHCGGALSRQVSEFATPSAGDSPDGDMPFDESKMTAAMERFEDKFDGMDAASADPAKSAEMIRQFSEASGFTFNKDMRDALRRMESGENPDAVAADMESIADSGADPFAPADRGNAKRSRSPERDPTLYEM